jgi:hypothetical protein
MINAFTVFFAIQEITFVFVLVSVDDFSFVGGLVVDPLSVVDSPTRILKDAMSVLFIFDPIADILIPVLVVVCSFSMFLSI